MVTIDFKTFRKRLTLLENINSDLSKEDALRYFKLEDKKLTRENEQILFAYCGDSSHPNKETILFRATVPYKGFDENTISCYSYPENPKLFRCNIPKYPVFYCSDHYLTSICEVLNNNKVCSRPIDLYLSTWRITKERKWKILPFIFLEIPTTNTLHEYAQKNVKNLFEKYKSHISEIDINEYIEFYNNEFRKENCYKFSSIISHKFLYEDDNDIIIFPSVRSNSKGNNYAINIKWIIDKILFCCKVHKFRVEKIDDLDNLEKCLVSIGVLKDDKIEWHQQ